MYARVLTALLGAAMVASACGAEPEPAARPGDSVVARALGGVPLLPGAPIDDLSGEGDAARASLHSRWPPDSVASWYRRALVMRGWTMVSDVRTPDGVVTLHATGPDRRPVWLLIASEGSGTVVTMVGAVLEAGKDTT